MSALADPPSNPVPQTDFRVGMQKMLIILGVVILAVGLFWPWLGRIGLGRLPGDFSFETGGAKFYVPIVTCIVISVVLTGILRFFGR